MFKVMSKLNLTKSYQKLNPAERKKVQKEGWIYLGGLKKNKYQ